MRIACLQFAPQVGDVDNNLNRADSVLARADQDDVDSLDLLVLPELAFSGYDFQCTEDIAPYLEPSGSGITSLWARTIALKHNTNVVVGYPEKAEVPGKLRSADYSGPEHFNSAILVNRDGETVQNYRKTFLYPLDETWAREGKDFFGGRVPGLGNTAIGIGTDINPYRAQAPWHAFEFAFHVLEVRANLVIISMAWATGEEYEHFTQFPNEPDMEALTYWAQRFEPVIRDESREEVIIVFCNRSGAEGEAVYAGTSAVIGIHEGEVKVYGVLGRGVKELLVVDTDDPPFANLVVRKEKNSGTQKSHGDQLKQSPAESLEKTPTNNHLGEEVPEATMYTSTNRNNSSRRTSPLRGSVPEGHTPTNSTSSSRAGHCVDHQRSTSDSWSAKEGGSGADLAVGKIDSATNHRVLGGSVAISFEEHEETEMDAFKPGPPPNRALPRLPTLPAITTKPTKWVKSSDESAAGGRSEEQEKTHPQSAVCEVPLRSRMLPDNEDDVPVRPKTATGVIARERGNTRPRESSRNVRHAETRAEEKRFGVLEAASPESSPPRSQSALAHRREIKNNLSRGRPRSPKSRNVSRSGRQADLDQGFSERALEIYLNSIAAKVRDGSLARNSMSAELDGLLRDRSKLPNTFSEPDQSSSSTMRSRGNIGSSDIGTGPDKSRAALWVEISQIVGEELRRIGSPEEARGRQRSRSANSMEVQRGSIAIPSTRGPEWPPARDRGAYARDSSVDSTRAQVGMRSTSHVRSTTPSQTRQGFAGGIRSVRDPSLGPPSDPEDEIVAEITFRRPSCQKCGSSACTGQRGRMTNVSRGNTPSNVSPRAVEENNADADRQMRQPLQNDEKQKTPTNSKVQISGLPPLQTSTDELSELRAPNLSRASARTLSSYEPSPITPPPRGLEPKALRAMAFGLNQEIIRLGAVDSLSKFGMMPDADSCFDERLMSRVEKYHSPV